MTDWFSPFYRPAPQYYQQWQQRQLSAERLKLLDPLFRAAQEQQYPVILPVLSQQLAFYAVMPSLVELHGLRSSLHAILGEAYSQIDMLIATSSTEIVARQPLVDVEWLLAQYPSGVLEIKALWPLPAKPQLIVENQWIFAALHQLQRLYHDKPPMESNRVRSLGRILRDFRLAEAVNDVAACQHFCDELKQHGGLSRDNVRWIEWRTWALHGQWQLLLDSIRPNDLQELPTKIRQLLLLAYAHQTGLWNDLQGQTLSARTPTQGSHYKSILKPLWITVPHWPLDDEGRLTWQIWWVGAQNAGVEIPALIEKALGEVWCTQMRHLRGLSQMQSTSTDLTTPSVDCYLELLTQVLTASPEARNTIMQQLQQMPTLYQQQIDAAYPHLIKAWRDLKQADTPKQLASHGWLMWLNQPIPTELPVDWEQQWITSSATWPVQTLKADALMTWAGQVPTTHTDLIVAVLLWMMERIEQLSAAQCVAAVGLMQQFQWIHPSLLQWLDQLLTCYLAQPSRQADYQQLLIRVTTVLTLNLTAKQITTALKLYERLIEAPIPDQSALQRSWQGVAEKIQTYWSRLSPSTRIHVMQLRQQLHNITSQANG